MSRSFDVVVIGAGPAGYIAAIRAAQLGKTVACIDEWKNKDGKNAFGGTCLNAGCIPSKALLESSELFHKAGHEFKKHGIKTGDVEMDIGAMQKRRAGIVRQLTGGIAGLFKAAKVEGLVGHGKLLKDKKVEFTPVKGDVEIIEAESVILAAGSTPIELPIAKFDGKQIIDSWDTLELDAVPETLGVVGAGVIGLELGSVWARLGSKVTILEAMEDFLLMADRDVAKLAAGDFKKQGLDIKLGAMVKRPQPARRAWRSSTKTRAAPRLLKSRNWSLPWVGVPSPRTCSPMMRVSSSMSVALLLLTMSAAHASKVCLRSVTAYADRCWRIRARKRASWLLT
jgi:dihydrolipoamide dehydrogenase